MREGGRRGSKERGNNGRVVGGGVNKGREDGEKRSRRGNSGRHTVVIDSGFFHKYQSFLCDIRLQL